MGLPAVRGEIRMQCDGVASVGEVGAVAGVEVALGWQALGRTGSFAEAFSVARDIVARQEAKEKVEASMPQMWLGPAIAPRLKLYGER